GALADEVLAPEEDAAAGDPARRAEDLHDRARDRRLPAAGLAREPDDLALVNRKIDAVHCARGPGAEPVLADELLHVEQRRGLGRPSQGGLLHDARHARPPISKATRRRRGGRSVRKRGLLTSSIPASNSTSPSTVNASAAPGKKKGHH